MAAAASGGARVGRPAGGAGLSGRAPAKAAATTAVESDSSNSKRDERKEEEELGRQEPLRVKSLAGRCYSASGGSSRYSEEEERKGRKRRRKEDKKEEKKRRGCRFVEAGLDSASVVLQNEREEEEEKNIMLGISELGVLMEGKEEKWRKSD